ncbi:MAG: 60S ribosomal export protein NMD3 [Candidatus Thorarchaeota archaeon]
MAVPCYVCGADSVVDGLCARCYDKSHPLLVVNTPLTLLTCRRCGAVKVPGGWHPIVPAPTNQSDLLDQQIGILLSNEAHLLHSEVDLGVEIQTQLDSALRTEIIAVGRSHPSLPPHEERVPVEIRLHSGTCETCGLMSGGYHEAIVQIRADGRQVTEAEIERITELVTRRTEAEYGKDMKAFVSHIQRSKYGLDFHIGSEHLSRLIADEIQSLFLAERKENYKLITQDRGGKRKYRVTILLRLPRYHEGDFVLVAGHPCQVLSIGKTGLSCFDLVDRSRFTVGPKSSKWKTIEYLAPSEETREYSVVAHGYHQPYQLMDSETYETIEVDSELLDPGTKVGDIVRVLWVEGRFHALPRIEEHNG